MEVTFDLPDEVVTQLQPFCDQLPQIIALGLREFNAIPQEGFSGLAEVWEFLASLPTESAIIALRPSEALQSSLTISVIYSLREKSDSRFDSSRGTTMATLSIFRAYCQNRQS
ncbi:MULTISPECIES: hypothetical protein [Moorena]|uniref:hypothetical protein n=1 Tax=Moorena TaxID=1155738 RepID=UPI001E40DF7A|nr:MULTISPECIES: hypothetical protein [Moorena]